MPRQRKPQVRSKASEETRKLDDALAVFAAHRRDVIFEATAMSVKELLRSSSPEHSLPKVIERIGILTGVDRVHTIEIDTDTPTERSPVVQHYVWSAPGISTSINLQEIKDPIADVGLASWVPRLVRGETIIGNARDFEPTARVLFEIGGVKSVIAVPIFVDGRW